MLELRNLLQKTVSSQKFGKDVLQSICRNCGLPLSSSYTKSKLVDIIADGLGRNSLIHRPVNTVRSVGEEGKLSRNQYDILSIDVGIKNFSYCKLQVDRKSPFDIPVTVEEWRKMDLLNWAQQPVDLEFNPTNYSNISSKLVFELILGLKGKLPDLILIERQRFRSMGSKNVLETVIRSAVLENMLFATLNLLQTLDPKTYSYQLQSSSPLLMTSYWENFKSLSNERYNMTDLVHKKHRIELVTSWLTNSKISIPRLDMNDESFKLKITKTRNSSRRLFHIVDHMNDNILSKHRSETQKGDDLADSLLHGITWLRFEQNKKKFYNTLVTDPLNLVDLINTIELAHINEISDG